MDTVVLSFRDEDDNSVEWEAVVDTLDPICAVIDNDDEPEVPQFSGCMVLDSSFGAAGGKNAFMVDYGPEDVASPDPATIEAVLTQFLIKHYGIKVLSFGPLPPE